MSSIELENKSLPFPIRRNSYELPPGKTFADLLGSRSKKEVTAVTNGNVVEELVRRYRKFEPIEITMQKCIELSYTEEVDDPEFIEASKALGYDDVSNRIGYPRRIGYLCLTSAGLVFLKERRLTVRGPFKVKSLGEILLSIGTDDETIRKVVRPMLMSLGSLGEKIGIKKIDWSKSGLSDEIRNVTQDVDVNEPIGYDRVLAYKALRDWPEFEASIIAGVDKRIADIYLPTLAPPYAPFYVAPCAFVGTPSRAGKTTLAGIVGITLERMTEASATGGGTREGRLLKSAFHEETRLIQIESLENAKKMLGGLLQITSVGKVRIAVWMQIGDSKVYAPVYITFNVFEEGEEELNNVIDAIFTNPHAQGARFIPFIVKRISRSVRHPYIEHAEVLNETVRAVHWVARKWTYRIYSEKAVQEFLVSTPLGFELPPYETSFRKLQIYMNSVRSFGYETVNKFAMLRAIAENLDTIVLHRQLNISKLVDDATEYAYVYLEHLREGLENVKEIGEKSINEEARKIIFNPDKHQKLLCGTLWALRKLLQKSPPTNVNAYVERRVKYHLNDFIIALKETLRAINAYTGKKKQGMPTIISKIKNKIERGEKLLRVIDLKIDEDNNIIIFDPVELEHIFSVAEENKE